MDNKVNYTELYTNSGGGSTERFTLEQIKDALDASADNVTDGGDWGAHAIQYINIYNAILSCKNTVRPL
jgi:hypothetical protein